MCDGLLAQLPDDQLLIAWRATALRAAGRRRNIAAVRLPAAGAHVSRCGRRRRSRTSAEFNAAFARELAPLHRAAHHPLEQSLRGGSQTERHLPRDNPVIAAFFAMLDAPIREYISAPARRGSHRIRWSGASRGGYRISGSWSVQLQPGGFHLNHVHPRGLAELGLLRRTAGRFRAATRAGWLEFGEPGMRMPGMRTGTLREARSPECWCCFRRTCGTARCHSRTVAAG